MGLWHCFFAKIARLYKGWAVDGRRRSTQLKNRVVDLHIRMKQHLEQMRVLWERFIKLQASAAFWAAYVVFQSAMYLLPFTCLSFQLRTAWGTPYSQQALRLPHSNLAGRTSPARPPQQQQQRFWLSAPARFELPPAGQHLQLGACRLGAVSGCQKAGAARLLRRSTGACANCAATRGKLPPAAAAAAGQRALRHPLRLGTPKE